MAMSLLSSPVILADGFLADGFPVVLAVPVVVVVVMSVTRIRPERPRRWAVR